MGITSSDANDGKKDNSLYCNDSGSLSQIRLVAYWWVQCILAHRSYYYLRWLVLMYSEAGGASFSVDESWVCICMYVYFYLNH